MEDDQGKKSPEGNPGAGDGTTPVPPPRRSRRRWPGVVIAVIGLPVLLMALWTATTLSWTYSRGNRAGYLQKISEKGWICKTWEGELQISSIPGSAPTIFAFTVRNDSVASQISRRTGTHVRLMYEEHRGVPTSCFGETQYYVTGMDTIP